MHFFVCVRFLYAMCVYNLSFIFFRNARGFPLPLADQASPMSCLLSRTYVIVLIVCGSQ